MTSTDNNVDVKHCQLYSEPSVIENIEQDVQRKT